MYRPALWLASGCPLVTVVKAVETAWKLHRGFFIAAHAYGTHVQCLSPTFIAESSPCLRSKNLHRTVSLEGEDMPRWRNQSVASRVHAVQMATQVPTSLQAGYMFRVRTQALYIAVRSVSEARHHRYPGYHHSPGTARCPLAPYTFRLWSSESQYGVRVSSLLPGKVFDNR